MIFAPCGSRQDVDRAQRRARHRMRRGHFCRLAGRRVRAARPLSQRRDAGSRRATRSIRGRCRSFDDRRAGRQFSAWLRPTFSRTACPISPPNPGSAAVLCDGAIKDAELIIVDNLSTIARGLRENEADSFGPVQSLASRTTRCRSIRPCDPSCRQRRRTTGNFSQRRRAG